MKTSNLKLGGLHCQGCAELIRSELANTAGVDKATVDYRSASAVIQYDETVVDESKLVEAVRGINYTAEPSLDAPAASPKRRYLIAGGAVLFILGLFFIARSPLLGLTGSLWDSELTWPVILAIGLVSGFHCVGMCGGFVAAYTAQAAVSNPGETWRPHLKYNLGRLVSYTVIGATLGLLGSAFTLNGRVAGFVTLAAAIFMIGVGLNLAGVGKMRWAQVNWLRWFPGFFSILDRVGRQSPLYLGLLTGLMPCGPLQAMQFYALSTGSALTGALSLGLYALGTMPALFGLGRAITSLGRLRANAVMRWAGAIVVILGLFAFGRGLSLAAGADTPSKPSPQAPISGQVQEVKMAVTYQGYVPNVIYLKKDVPVRWVIDGAGVTGCTDEIVIHGYNIRKKLSRGETIVEFTPTATGEIRFSCWMNMVWGKFIVTEDGQGAAGAPATESSAQYGQQGACAMGEVCTKSGCGCAEAR